MNCRIVSRILVFLAALLLIFFNIQTVKADWYIETLDSSSDDVGEYTSIALNSNEYPHISYYDRTNGDLKWTYWNGNSWIVGVLDSDGDVGRFSSITLRDDDVPFISYHDFTNGDLKLITPL